MTSLSAMLADELLRVKDDFFLSSRKGKPRVMDDVTDEPLWE